MKKKERKSTKKKTNKIVKRIGIGIGILFLLVPGIAAAGLIFMINAPMPRVKGTVKTAGVLDRVEIIRDSMGVPHIYADSLHDLFFAQGYVHAQDRFVQMEFGRRIAQGRLAEIFGSMIVEVDRYVRVMGLSRVVEKEVAQLDDESRAILEAYSKGVNAYLKSQKNYGLELELLGLQGARYTPDPWTAADSVSWLKVMALNISANMKTELRNVEVIQTLGMEAIHEVWPLYQADKPLIIPEEISYETLDIHNHFAENDVLEKTLTLSGVGIGSNSWVISGEHTDTGKPYLANDPHLGIQMPSTWYEVGLHYNAPDEKDSYNVTGVSFSGLPGVIIGHNSRIAWGLTILPSDTQDLFIERVNPDNPSQYEVNGEWADFEVVYETILVRGKLAAPEKKGTEKGTETENANPALSGEYDPATGFTKVVIPVHKTRHGPVINDLSKEVRSLQGTFGEMEMPPRHVTSLSWVALEPTNTVKAIFKLNRAGNFSEFREAMRYFDNPTQNVVYADVDGNIGFQAPGKIPIRKKGNGQLPVPGWNGEYDWQGYIPFEELPYLYNPDEGFITACNNNVTGENYPYLISMEWDPGSRAQRVIDLIKEYSAGSFTMEENKKIQFDTYDMPAKDILAYLKKVDFEEPELQEALSFLTGWDCLETADSGEAALYAIFWTQLNRTLFAGKLPAKSWPNEEAVAILMADRDSPWWDNRETGNRVENRDESLALIFTEAYSSAKKLMGPDLSKWKWETIHEAQFQNSILGGVPVLGLLFNRGPVKVQGGPGVINSIGWEIGEDPLPGDKATYKVNMLPSMRMVVDLANLDNSEIIHTTGQSGHPFNKHYDDMIKLWQKNEYHKQLWDRASVDKAAKNILILEP